MIININKHSTGFLAVLLTLAIAVPLSGSVSIVLSRAGFSPGPLWTTLSAEVFRMPQDALKAHFPKSLVIRRARYLTERQKSELEKQLGFRLQSRLHTFYEARKRGKLVGLGIFDTHIVRSKDETLFIVLEPNGTVRSVETISFYEPPDYLAPPRWLKLFSGKSSPSEVVAGRNLPGITGATLTSRAVSKSVRKVLLLYRVHFSDKLADRS